MMRKTGLMMAMMSLAMACDPGMARAFSQPLGRRREPQPRQLSEEEIQAITEQKTNEFAAKLDKWNATRSLEFPQWKALEVSGLPIYASNLKNAHKIYRKFLAECGLEEITPAPEHKNFFPKQSL